jgi:LacI family transcriptional regulator
MRQAYELGITVPEELSVIGFDDIRLSEFITPPLTTVQMSQTELARTAFTALMNEVSQETPSERRREYRLKTNLVLRRSTAMAQGGSRRATVRHTTTISAANS